MESSSGDSDEDQVSGNEQPLEEDVKCPLCLDLFTDPCYVCPNHHTLCRGCYQGVVDSSSMGLLGARCPQCRERLSRPVENGHLRGLIEARLRQSAMASAASANASGTSLTPAEPPRRAACHSCGRRAFSHCGHCGRDLCDLHFSAHRLAFQAECHRLLQTAAATSRAAERHEAALIAWEALVDACASAVQQRRARLRATITATATATTTAVAMTAMGRAAGDLRTALEAGDLRAAGAARDRLASARAAAEASAAVEERRSSTPRSGSTSLLTPPPLDLTRHLAEVRLVGLLDEMERLFREFGTAANAPSSSLSRQHWRHRLANRRRIDSVRASDLAVVTLDDGDLAREDEGGRGRGGDTQRRRRPLWCGANDGLRWPNEEEAAAAEEASRQEALYSLGPDAAMQPLKSGSWHPLPSPVLYCKTPNSRQLYVLEPRSGRRLATIAVEAAAPHLLERLIYSHTRQRLLLSNGQSVLECSLTGECRRRLDGFRGATGIALDEGTGRDDGRLFVLESRLGCVLVYAANTLAPMQTLGPFGRGLQSLCYLSGGGGVPAMLLLSDRAASSGVRAFIGRGCDHLTPVSFSPATVQTAVTSSTLVAPSQTITALTADPSGRLAFAASAAGVSQLAPFSYEDDATANGDRALRRRPLVDAAQLGGRTPDALAVLLSANSGGSMELLVCSGDAFAIDALQLTAAVNDGGEDGEGDESEDRLVDIDEESINRLIERSYAGD